MVEGHLFVISSLSYDHIIMKTVFGDVAETRMESYAGKIKRWSIYIRLCYHLMLLFVGGATNAVGSVRSSPPTKLNHYLGNKCY